MHAPAPRTGDSGAGRGRWGEGPRQQRCPDRERRRHSPRALHVLDTAAEGPVRAAAPWRVCRGVCRASRDHEGRAGQTPALTACSVTTYDARHCAASRPERTAPPWRAALIVRHVPRANAPQ